SPLVDPVEDGAGAANRDRHGLGGLVRDDHPWGQRTDTQWHFDRALGVALAHVDREPEKERQEERDELEPRVSAERGIDGAERGEAEEAAPGGQLLRRSGRRRLGDRTCGARPAEHPETHHPTKSRCRVVRNVPGSTSRVIFPSRTSDTMPSSSETTIA